MHKTLIIFSILILFVCCKSKSKKPNRDGNEGLPTVSTAPVTLVSPTTAVCGGTVTDSGGSDVTARGVCWSTSPSPGTSDEITIDGSGTGEFTSALTWLTPSTSYYIRAYAANSEGTGYGSTSSFTTEEGGNCETCVDIDGNSYETMQIGNQCWMVENLKVTHYNNGDPIPNITGDYDWDTIHTGAYCEYNNEPSNVSTYGRLYNYYAVDDPRGLAPVGWHVPTDDEWKTLEILLGMEHGTANLNGFRGTNQGSKLSGRAELWKDGALDSDPEFGTSGFSALPGGIRNSDGSFAAITDFAIFWSSSEYSTNETWCRFLFYINAKVIRANYVVQRGFSVRCVRD